LGTHANPTDGKRSVRIGHVLPFPTVGGTEHATLRIARAVSTLGYESVAFYCRAATPVAEFFRRAALEVAPYDPVFPSYIRPWRFLQNSIRLAGDLRRRRIDLVHCSDLLGAYYAGLAGRLAGLPVLCHIRSRRDQLSLRERGFLCPVDRYAFVSNATWQDFGIRVGPERGRVIYDGVDFPEEQVAQQQLRHEVFQEFGIPSSSAVVTMVARLAAAKDHPTLARAAARVAVTFPDVHFLLVGAFPSPEVEDRHYFSELKSLIESLHLLTRFTFTGYRSDTSRIVAASDVIVLCTHAEGLPLVVLEAMAQAKAVVATAVDGIPEIIKDGETGLLHGHEDAEQLGDQLLFLLKDPDGAVRLGKAGQQFCRERFGQAQFAESMAAYYRDVIEASSSRRLLSKWPRGGRRGY